MIEEEFKQELDEFMVKGDFSIPYNEEVVRIVSHMLDWQKRQMTKNAVSGTIEFVERDGMCKPTILYEPNPNNKMQLGEEVKIIIIKP